MKNSRDDGKGLGMDQDRSCRSRRYFNHQPAGPILVANGNITHGWLDWGAAGGGPLMVGYIGARDVENLPTKLKFKPVSAK